MLSAGQRYRINTVTWPWIINSAPLMHLNYSNDLIGIDGGKFGELAGLPRTR